MKKLIETIDISVMSGIFSEIRTQDSGDIPLLPWLDDDYAQLLDVEYYLKHSGDKGISIYFQRLLKFQEDGVIGDALTVIAQTTMSKFYDKWNKLYSAFVESTYKPLENYDMEQTEEPDITKTRNVKTDVSVETKDDISDTDVYGFNSSSAVPSGKVTRNGTVTTTGDADDNEEVETETGTRSLTRHGNIGVTTSQQMLQSEIDLRNNFNFMEQLFDDVDSELCLLVY